MTLNKSRFIVRWFFWSLDILDAFTDGYGRRYRVQETGTNLCYFFQITFVWVPLILLAHLAAYGLVFAALTVAPIYFFGVGGYVSAVGAIVAVVAIAIGAVALSGWLKDRPRKAVRYDDDRGPSSLGIVWAFAVAQKRKVCPMISFNQQSAR